jgi:nucleoside-diphosphate-sugar epimerase
VNILLTGAGGFVGSHVARRLLSGGHETVAVVNPDSSSGRLEDIASRLTIVSLDICQESTLERLGSLKPEVCIHAAWYARPTDYLDSRRNVDHMAATLRLALRLADAGCRRFVGLGTCFEYGASDAYLSESSTLAPGHLYSACKVGTWHALEQIGRVTGMSVAWARLFHLYGPFEDPRRLVPSVIQNLIDEKPTDATPGGQVRDFLHVQDVASALIALATGSLEGAVNVASGVPVTVAHLVTALGEIVGRPDLVRLGALPYRPGDPMFVCADNRRLIAECAWTPQFSLRAGLQQTVDWWRERRPSKQGAPESAK